MTEKFMRQNQLDGKTALIPAPPPALEDYGRLFAREGVLVVPLTSRPAGHVVAAEIMSRAAAPSSNLVTSPALPTASA
jgi:hypothetical protein